MFNVRGLRVCLAATLLVLMPLVSLAQTGRGITVLAAASLTNVMQEVGKRYETASGKGVVFSFAASMILAKQIEAAAPADMFISADLDWMDYLQDRKLIKNDTRSNLLGNRIVLIAAKDSKLSTTIAPGFNLAGLLGAGRLAAQYDGPNGRKKLRTEGKRPVIRLQGGRVPSCGPFKFEFRVWDRQPEDLEPLARDLGSTIRSIRRDLDSASGAGVLQLLDELHRELNTTILLVTHDAHTAQSCQRMLILRDGRVAEDSTLSPSSNSLLTEAL